MTKTAYLFSGQGAQKLGMGRDLYDRFASVRATFDRASELIGYDLRSLIDSDDEKLNLTEFTQPAILATSVAIWRLLEENGLKADLVAGLSLGEYSALVVSGALSFDDAIQVVAKRGKFMAEAAPAGIGKMVAVMKTDSKLIEEICQVVSEKTGKIVSPANYNTKDQIVIGGEAEAVDMACEALKEAGSKRLIELKVSGPFHTALLKPASEKLAGVLEDVKFNDFDCPLISNTTAQTMSKADIKGLLARQVMEPVRFYESVAEMQALGVTRFVEVGPGRVLSGFIKKIMLEAEIANIEGLESFEKFISEENK